MYVIYSTDETKLTLTSKSNICNHASQGKESCYATKFTFKNHTEGNTSFFLCKEKILSHDGGLFYPSRAQKINEIIFDVSNEANTIHEFQDRSSETLDKVQLFLHVKAFSFIKSTSLNT
jgi:hypothetical protein